MSNTKGSILISNANAVGTALVNKLGGTGYKPSKWSDAVNIMGIASADIPTALANITEGSYTGSDRGSIEISTANSIGAVMNKKFNTSRGFKPTEWESAISKLTPLSEGTVSGSICNIINGAEDVPLKSWFVNIPANLSGVSSIECTEQGANFYPISVGNDRFSNNGGATHSEENGALIINATTNNNCGVYINTNDTLCEIRNVLKFLNDANSPRIISFDVVATVDNVSFAVTSGSRTVYTIGTTKTRINHVSTGVNCSMYVQGSDLGVNTTVTVSNFQISAGSTATAYTPYTAPTVNTVDLGRTVYGADVDVVNGSGSETHKIFTASDVTGLYWNNKKAEQVDTNHRATFRIFLSSGYITINNSLCNELSYTNVTGGSGANEGYQIIATAGIYFCIDLSDIGMENATSNTPDQDFLDAIHAYGNNLVFCVELSTPTNFTFDPITPTPETPLGVSNWWSEQGESSITYRKDPDIPDPPVQLLNMNNNENNNNEGV